MSQPLFFFSSLFVLHTCTKCIYLYLFIFAQKRFEFNQVLYSELKLPGPVCPSGVKPKDVFTSATHITMVMCLSVLTPKFVHRMKPVWFLH